MSNWTNRTVEGDVVRERISPRLPMAVLLVAGLAGCAAPQPHDASSPAPVVEPALSEQDMPMIRTEYVYSEHRQAPVQLYLAYPGALESTADLPMVLYLHGRDGVWPTPIPYDTLASLERLYREGSIPAFGFAVVDGGYNPYWNDGSLNGDLAALLHNELPRWLQERGMGDRDGRPFAVAGISTGGFGALNYAADRNLAGHPVAAVAAVAPALQVSWEGMREKEAFATEEDWSAVDPLRRLGDLGDVPVGVWTGDEDPFLDGIHRLVDEYPHTPVVSVLPGGHDPSVFEAIGPDFVTFLADALGSGDADE
ncbi:alpha/beta hydrolase-fold protein [Saccharopolyspora pogona]|uniref:alpha/beta hydrolase-fold protein n=1 Tax=Saccharopolyspora pogona TaxID=333966 RepID=UPI001CC22461|nr:alpha/beta hydrolase-fold protein [Saccharopolyspora pogona]